jgi:hypothetical protein
MAGEISGLDGLLRLPAAARCPEVRFSVFVPEKIVRILHGQAYMYPPLNEGLAAKKILETCLLLKGAYP